MEHLISIIVPVYKVEKYIHKCIDSIINQTYKNLEIILKSRFCYKHAINFTEKLRQ